MLIDCDHCAARDVRCDSCVLGLLLGPTVRTDGSDASAGIARAATAIPQAMGAGPPTDRSSTPATAVTAGAETVVMVDIHTSHVEDFDTAERGALAALAAAGLIGSTGLVEELQLDTKCAYTLTERHSLAG